MNFNENNNSHEKVKYDGNCSDNNLYSKEKISETKSNVLTDSEKTKERNIEENKYNGIEEK